MPFKKDAQGGGSEADGTRSRKYCSSCYENGAFKHPEMTMKDMQQLVDGVLKNEMRWPGFLRWLAVRQISKLQRWKVN
jgi:hypothetical protein